MKSVTLLLAIMLACSTGLAQLQNGGFEEWVNSDPANWHSFDEMAPLGSVEPVRPAYEGSWAARLATSEFLEAAIVWQDFGPLAIGDEARFSLYYSAMTPGMVGELVAVGFRGEDEAGAALAQFTPAGNNFLQVIALWTGDIQECDSLSIMITLSSASEEPVIGSVTIDAVVMEGFSPLDVKIDESRALPETSLLLEAFPNPFNGGTQIRFAAPSGATRLQVLDMQGRLVTNLLQAPVAGNRVLNWNPTVGGAGLPAGTYRLVLTSGREVRHLPLILLK
ncbi:MAG: T9SS type A sorting domain-containing protein [Calditrichaeota bacterium]|nr:T9SS type A sorting domain-containing protein [Calditrichota bacterium]